MSRGREANGAPRGTRLGVPDPVRGGWSDYTPTDAERHTREVHTEVLRKSGFDRDRAESIAAASSEETHRLLEQHRDDGARPPHAIRPAREASGFDIRRHIAGLDRE
jgi:hypothetical protein